VSAAPAPDPLSGNVETWARELLWNVDAFAHRSQQMHLGPSEVGNPCDRALVFKMAGVEPVNVGGVSLAAMAGTGMHATLAEGITRQFASTNRYLIEHRVEYRGVSGTADLFDRQLKRVVDWKTASKEKLRRIKAKRQWTPQWTVQTAIYGAGMEAAGETVEEVSIVLIPRDGELSDVIALTRPYDRDIADKAIDRLEELAGARPSEVSTFPSALCGWCPFFRANWLGDRDVACPGMTAA
jgi:hypothetical protein